MYIIQLVVVFSEISDIFLIITAIVLNIILKHFLASLKVVKEERKIINQIKAKKLILCLCLFIYFFL